MRLKSTLTSGLIVLAGAICTYAAEVNSSPSRREPMAVTPELLDQAFVSLKGFDVKPEASAPQPKEMVHPGFPWVVSGWLACPRIPSQGRPGFAEMPQIQPFFPFRRNFRSRP